jgi:hypothetical protein
MKDINYLLAIGYALIGWIGQVTYYYFQFDTDEALDRLKFWRVYDKYIILGFVSAITLSLLGDFGWADITAFLRINVQYDERVNIFIGLLSSLIILFISRKAKEKLN